MRSMLQSTVFENPPKSLILQDIWSENTNVTFWVIFKQCAVVVFMVVKVVAKTRARWSGNVFVPLGKKPKASYFLGVEQILFTCINGLEQATQNDVEGGHKPKTTLILRQKSKKQQQLYSCKAKNVKKFSRDSLSCTEFAKQYYNYSCANLQSSRREHQRPTPRAQPREGVCQIWIIQ